jgi:hypothetical protein
MENHKEQGKVQKKFVVIVGSPHQIVNRGKDPMRLHGFVGMRTE